MALKDLVSKGVRGETSIPSASQPTSPAATPPPPSSPAPRSAPAALLDASVEFTGTITCQESIRIDGRCRGELHSDHAVIIGEPAVLQMSIDADSVVVAGQVSGDITARRKITLERTARVRGNLCTPGIVIQEGAQLEGRIVIGSEAESAAQAKSAAAPAEQAKARGAEDANAPTPAEDARARVPADAEEASAAKDRPARDPASPSSRKPPTPSAPPPAS